MAKVAPRLGRGLSALVTPRAAGLDASAAKPPAFPTQPGKIHDIDLDRIRPNPNQPRASFDDESLRELADSIRTNGILQPVVVRACGEDAYELIAGERRWRAARLAGLSRIAAIVREANDAQSFELALIENLQRSDLAPLERAGAYRHYLDTFGGTVESLAERLSESRANVSNYLRLLGLQDEVRAMLARGELSMGHARALAGVADQQRQLALARMTVRRNLSVRQVEELARRVGAGGAPRSSVVGAGRAPGAARHASDVEQALSRAVGLRVRLFPGRKKNSGRVVIYYSSLEEFDRVAQLIGGDKHLE